MYRDLAMADVPTTKKKLQGLMEKFMRMRDQGVQIPKPPPPASREERYLFRGIPVEGFRELQRVFVPKASDVYIASYPKSGTTWVQHIVSLIKNNGVDDGQDLDDKWLWYEQFSAAEVEVSVLCSNALHTENYNYNFFSDTLLAVKELECSKAIFLTH